jgi:PhnB protein
MESRTPYDPSPDETTIRRAIENWRKSVHAKDVDAVISHYAADFRAFDIAPPLQSRGTDTWRSGLKMWFGSWEGPISIEMRELEVAVDGTVAYSTSVNHLAGVRRDGEKTDVWVRATIGWRKTKGEWLVAHEHVSVPFYMDGSMRAAVDLKP